MTRKELRIEDLEAICDTREQTPLDLSPLRCVPGTLQTADYSLSGMEHLIAVERKSLSDLCGVIGHGRERFEREIQRLIAYPYRLIVIEAHISQIQLKQYRSEVHPHAVLGSVLGWMARGVPVLFAGDHAEAGKMVARFLFIAARRRWEEAQALCSTLKIAK